ncbi:hypothetical protein [Tropicimonas sp. IMCC34043]|uniref:hypothetical protein n=1 Tax=Tropicimonas sp. IMCC34043 TaxID=2248760 RepID=UPI0013009E2B|nr:hypothetical protein [Tropicimonas sp. IMCC34043]
MTPQEMIAVQIKRMEKLQEVLQSQRADAEDVKSAETLRATRATSLRAAIDRLERQKKDTTARIDAEIALHRRELTELDRRSDFDLTRRQAGSATPAPEKRKAATTITKKTKG